MLLLKPVCNRSTLNAALLAERYLFWGCNKTILNIELPQQTRVQKATMEVDLAWQRHLSENL